MYYTPNKEEFHLGFRYELRSLNGKWSKHKLTNAANLRDVIAKLSHPSSSVRVKHLDKQDIEETGWKITEDHPSYIEATMKDTLGRDLDLFYTKDIQILEIYIADTEDTIYWGNCKNYNELSKIMDWMHII